MSWASELPTELLSRPLGLVGLTGLDTTYNAVHKAIWDSFCNNRRPDRVPLNFKVFAVDHEYPKCKPKKASYEYYIPRGVLKRDWLTKHLDAIPSLVVIFFDLDWDNTIWKEKQMECSTKVEIVRNSLLGRGTKVCMVLVQKNTPLPPGEDMVAAERAASLCSACELSAKSLFVLPLTDHLLGYTIRLENAFYELSQSYYHQEARKVKAHKEFLNKTTHQLLYIRHQFKVAFLSELKQDTQMALKHYKQAYGHIVETRMYDTNLLEIKTIAGFISYKICRLSFHHNTPLDSIAQFRKHIDFFKGRVGCPELAFEHSAWMAKQFQVFGELFDEAIKSGLTAIQTQHPGFYFQQAANHAIARKQLCWGLCHHAHSSQVDVTEIQTTLKSLDYLGQRGWRQGHQSIEPPDAAKEKEGIQALQALEVSVDHSWQIIPLLSSAVAQFKKYKSPRMKRYLMVQMGEEYYHAQDYTKALALLSRVTWDYRQERWWPLLTSILQTALRCAYLVANTQEYVTFCLELAGKYTQCSPEEKSRIQMNLLQVLKGKPPTPEPGCNPACVDKARTLWEGQPSSSGSFTVEMQSIVSCVECKACFTQDSFTADQPVVIKVYIRVNCLLPVDFNKLTVLLCNQAYNSQCTVETDGETRVLSVEPGRTLVKTFTFIPQSEDVGKSLEMTSVVLELGQENQRCAILHWTAGGGASLPPALNQHKTKRRVELRDGTPWDQVEVVSVTRIRPRESRLHIELQHASPCLVNEFYEMKVKLVNQEEGLITGVSLDLGLKEAQGIEVAQTTHISVDKPSYTEGADKTPLLKDLKLPDLNPKQELTQSAFLRAWSTGDRKLQVKVSYSVSVQTSDCTQLVCQCMKEEQVSLSTVTPFQTTVRLASLQFRTIESVNAEEPFLLLTELRCLSPWRLEIERSSFALSPHATFVDETIESHLEGVKLQNSDCASECQCLMVPPPPVNPTPLGQYYIRWRRQTDNPSIPIVSTLVTLPSVEVTHVPMYVDLDLPSYGNVRQSFTATYHIYNRTSFLQEIEISMDSSESFMFAGQKKFHLRILPNSKYDLQYNMVPLLPGNAPLPKLHLNMKRLPGVMEDIVQAMLPSHIFIMPSGKSLSDLELTAPVEA